MFGKLDVGGGSRFIGGNCDILIGVEMTIKMPHILDNSSKTWLKLLNASEINTKLFLCCIRIYWVFLSLIPHWGGHKVELHIKIGENNMWQCESTILHKYSTSAFLLSQFPP